MHIKSLYLLILIACASAAPCNAQNIGLLDWISQNKAQSATIAAALGVGAFVINRFSKSTHRQQLAKNKIDFEKKCAHEQDVKEFKKDLEAKINRNPALVVAKKFLNQREAKAHRDRHVLLPVILHRPNDFDLRAYIEEAYNHSAKTVTDYNAKKTHEERLALEKKGPIAVHVYVISPRHDPNHQSFACYQQQSVNPEQLFIKSVTDPKLILGRELLTGECAIIGFSDGSTQIHINKTDSDALIDLSDEQHAFIVSLSSHRFDDPINLNQQETETFTSLGRHLQTNLKSNYSMTPYEKPIDNIFPEKTSKTLLGFGAFLTSCALLAQKYNQSTRTNFVVNAGLWAASTLAYIVNTFHYDESTRKSAWKIPIIYCATTQAFEQGPSLLNKLSGTIKK